MIEICKTYEKEIFKKMLLFLINFNFFALVSFVIHYKLQNTHTRTTHTHTQYI